MKIRTAVLTVSTLGSQGKREDTSGELIKELIRDLDTELIAHRIVPDNQSQIRKQLLEFIDKLAVDLILTTGGTGLSPDDLTPEATLEVIERRVPGIEEAMRFTGLQKTPYAMLSRGVVGVRRNSLIINLPGSPKGVRENLEAIISVIPHAIRLLRGHQTTPEDHTPPPPPTQ